jgi:hypothetical protein
MFFLDETPITKRLALALPYIEGVWDKTHCWHQGESDSMIVPGINDESPELNRDVALRAL